MKDNFILVAELARKESSRNAERISKRVSKRKKKQRKRDIKRSIRKINREIKKAIRNGRFSVSFDCDTIRLNHIKKDIINHYESKGYQTKTLGTFGKWDAVLDCFSHCVTVIIDWSENKNE